MKYVREINCILLLVRRRHRLFSFSFYCRRWSICQFSWTMLNLETIKMNIYYLFYSLRCARWILLSCENSTVTDSVLYGRSFIFWKFIVYLRFKCPVWILASQGIHTYRYTLLIIKLVSLSLSKVVWVEHITLKIIQLRGAVNNLSLIHI